VTDLDAFRQAGAELYDRLRLDTYPVAVQYIRDESSIPEGFFRPTMNGQKWSLCQAFTWARRWGWNVAMTSEDNFCVPAAAANGWEDVSLEDLIESQVIQGWHKDREAENRRFSFGHYLALVEHGEKTKDHIGFLCNPLPRTEIIPDSIVVFGTGLQITHIIHALTYEFKYTVASTFDGYVESCVKGGLLPFLLQEPQIIIPGAGDRSFAAIMDHEIGIGLPGNLLFYVTDNLFKTGGPMNIGMPLKTVMAATLDESITPGFQYLRQKIDEKKSRDSDPQ